jgi:two-component system nitrogen regulation response regulator GlnG
MAHDRKRTKTPQVHQGSVTAMPGNEGAKAPASVPIPALTIVWHPDARRVGERLILYPVPGGGEVSLSRNEPHFSRPGALDGEPLADPFISRRPILLAPSASGGITIAVPEGVRLLCGTTSVEERIDLDPGTLARGVPLTLAGRVVVLLHAMEPSLASTASALGMVGESAGTRSVRAQVEQVAGADCSVLIRGESGTGKELVARAIHDNSPRRMGPFVAVNLATLRKDLAAAELFGVQQRGAYTGAVPREGLFKAARGGTLFLDEVGEAEPELQTMLLRVLEVHEMFPVGAEKPVPVDVRVIAATDADLEAQIEGGRFKTPLLYRLAEYEIHIPPLRERREDVGLLIRHFAAEELAANGEGHVLASTDPYVDPWLPAATAAQLVMFDWPGNIRQLRNVVRRIVLGSRGQTTARIDPAVMSILSLGRKAPSAATSGSRDAEPPTSPRPPSGARPARRKAAEITEEELVAALRANRWDLKAAADELEIPRTSIYDLIARTPGLRTAGEIGAEEIQRAYDECDGDIDRMVEMLQISEGALRRRLKELSLKARKPGKKG